MTAKLTQEHPVCKNSYIIIHCSCPDRQSAELIGERLLNKKLAACISYSSEISSNYWWQGKIEHSTEVLLVAKTKADLFEKIEQTIVEHHPYDVPEIVATAIINGSHSYLQWIDQCLLEK